MNWAKVAKKVGKFAPLIGKVLPIPGGGLIGTMVATALGVDDTPDAVSKALDTDPDAAIKLQALQVEERTTLARVAGETAIGEAVNARMSLEAINQTMRAESVSEHWPQYSWRPAIGFTFAFCCLSLIVGSLILAGMAMRGGTVAHLTQVPALIGAFTVILGCMAGVLGVAAHHRGQEKRTKAERVSDFLGSSKG